MCYANAIRCGTKSRNAVILDRIRYQQNLLKIDFVQNCIYVRYCVLTAVLLKITNLMGYDAVMLGR
jgi:hypothetical protein